MQAYATCKRYGYTLAMERSAEDTVALNDAITAAGLGTYSELHSKIKDLGEWFCFQIFGSVGTGKTVTIL